MAVPISNCGSLGTSEGTSSYVIIGTHNTDDTVGSHGIEDAWAGILSRRASLGRVASTTTQNLDYLSCSTPDRSSSIRRIIAVGIPAHRTADNPSILRIVAAYAQCLLVSFLIALGGNLLAFALSLLKWESSESQGGGSRDPGQVDSFAFAIIGMLMFVCALPIFTAVQFIVVYGFKRWKATSMIWVTLAVSISAAALSIGLWRSGWPWWFYYVDVFIIASHFGVCTFFSGYYGQRRDITGLQSPDWRERTRDGIMFMVIEFVVAVSALAYGIWFIPIYMGLSNEMRMLWRFTVHPIYWEAIVKLAARHLLISKAGDKLSVLDTLAMAHAQSHLIIMQASMVTTVNTLLNTLTTILTVHVGRFFWRSTDVARTRIFYRLFRRFITTTEDKKDVSNTEIGYLEVYKYLLAIETMTEILLENSAVMFLSTTGLLFRNYTNAFWFNQSEIAFEWYHAPLVVTIQIVGAFIFDLLTIYVNSRYTIGYRNGSNMPLLCSWREIWAYKWRFIGFSAYSLLTMGFIAQVDEHMSSLSVLFFISLS
ncbi:hypothetical protein SpCBS45565_g04412 [Spizellomyces sp. 'palustris']|nr:hypothetical protein SpCBS45565_g04412 [Spizellomyces sp. 'palustris']